MLAAIRPDSWNLPLLVHVAGAMVLVGGLATAVGSQVLGWRAVEPGARAAFSRVAFRALVLVAFPAWLVMRIGAEWISSREGYGGGDGEPGWLGIGYVTADLGVLLLLASILLAGFSARRLGRSDEVRGAGLGRAAAVLSAIVLVAYLVAVWAMTAKPS